MVSGDGGKLEGNLVEAEGAVPDESAIPVDLYFSESALEAGVPVNIFQHIHKTGGTALRSRLSAKLEGVADFQRRVVGRERAGLHAAYRELYEGLAKEERARLHWAVGHSANYLIPLLERPVSVYTIVRDPLDRVLASYFSPGSSSQGLRTLDTLRQLHATLGEVGAGSATEATEQQDFVAPAFRDDYANGQSRSLLEPFFDVAELPSTPGPPPEADLWRERLFTLVEGYVLLLCDRLSESIGMVGNDLGWATDEREDVRVDSERPQAGDVDGDLRATVYAYNWLDRELYRHAAASLKASQQKFKAYKRQVGPLWKLEAESSKAKGTPRRRESLTPLDVYLSPTPHRLDDPVNIYQHIEKTGGTAFRTWLNTNLENVAEFQPYPIPKRGSQEEMRKLHSRLYRQLTEEEQARLLWVAGHTANYLIPLLKRPVRLMTIVREPLDRVLSRYYFAGDAEKRKARSLDALQQILGTAILGETGGSNGADPASGSQSTLSARKADYANGQSRSLMEPFFDLDELPRTPGSPPEADLWRERLFSVAEGYTLLVQERLEESIEALESGFGWSGTVPRVRVNRERPDVTEVDSDLRATIYAYNWLDVELHGLAVSRLEERARR